MGVNIPEAYGGLDADFLFSVVIMEEFARANVGGIGGPMAVHSDIVAHYLLNSGSEMQKQEYLPRMVSGECVGAVAMTEPGAGSDLQGIRTTAKKDGEHYVINGAKTFITNGQHCDMVIVVARTNPDVSGAKGTTLFLVDADTPGFQRGRNLEKIGLHASDTSELFFEDVRVHESAILGELDRGFMVLMGELQRERLAPNSPILVQARYVRIHLLRFNGRLPEARDEALDDLREKYTKRLTRLDEKIRRAEERVEREESQYSQQKMQTAISIGASLVGALFGRKIASFGVSQHKIADMATDITLGQMLALRLGRLKDETECDLADIHGQASADPAPFSSCQPLPAGRLVTRTRVEAPFTDGFCGCAARCRDRPSKISWLRLQRKMVSK